MDNSDSIPEIKIGIHAMNISESEKNSIRNLEYYFNLTHYDFYEIQNCIDSVGFDTTYNYLKKGIYKVTNLPYLSVYLLKNFENLTNDLIPKKIIKSIVTCFVCKSNNVLIQQIQTRSSDEPATDFYSCQNCGNQWKKN